MKTENQERELKTECETNEKIKNELEGTQPANEFAESKEGKVETGVKAEVGSDQFEKKVLIDEFSKMKDPMQEYVDKLKSLDEKDFENFKGSLHNNRIKVAA